MWLTAAAGATSNRENRMCITYAVVKMCMRHETTTAARLSRERLRGRGVFGDGKKE